MEKNNLKELVLSDQFKWTFRVYRILKETKTFAESLGKSIGDISPIEADIALIKFFAGELGKEHD